MTTFRTQAETSDCEHVGTEAYAAVQFEALKPSLRTFLKFWLMGKPVARRRRIRAT